MLFRTQTHCVAQGLRASFFCRSFRRPERKCELRFVFGFSRTERLLLELGRLAAVSRGWKNSAGRMLSIVLRLVHTMRFGALYMVDGLNRGHQTLDGARQIARGEA